VLKEQRDILVIPVLLVLQELLVALQVLQVQLVLQVHPVKLELLEALQVL
jgi:hypothetical protein